MIEVIEAGPLSTVQDLGRLGYEHVGIAVCGAMDSLALRAANLLAGNAGDAAGLEVTVAPLALKFYTAMRVAVTGGGYRFSMDGRVFPAWWSVKAMPGQVLRVLPAPHGGRAYLAVQGGIDVPEIMGSRSTDLKSRLGGLEGRRLLRGDWLSTFPVPGEDAPGGPYLRDFGLLPPIEDWQGGHGVADVRFIPASEYSLLPDADRRVFHETVWRVSAESNRMGYRLAGPALRLEGAREMRSYGIVPGTIQLPPAGNPIVQLCEANTMGGYPKLGVIIQADLRRLAQCPIGGRVRFTAVSRDAALGAAAAQQALFARWQRAVAWMARDPGFNSFCFQ